jgi:hypothetical protein
VTDLRTLHTHLRVLLVLLDTVDHGELTALAALLAARGYPTSTAAGAHGTTEDTSVELAALNPDRFNDADVKLARWATTMVDLTAAGHRFITDLGAHADPTTRQAPGVGWCLTCDRFCAGGPIDRLRAGWCPACAESYRRWRTTHPTGDRAAFMLWRQRGSEARRSA